MNPGVWNGCVSNLLTFSVSCSTTFKRLVFSLNIIIKLSSKFFPLCYYFFKFFLQIISTLLQFIYLFLFSFLSNLPMLLPSFNNIIYFRPSYDNYHDEDGKIHPCFDGHQFSSNLTQLQPPFYKSNKAHED